MKIGIIGMGLIGGSLGRALVRGGEHEVLAWNRSEEAMQKGALLDAYHRRLTEADYAELDVVIVTIFPEPALKMMEEIAPKLKKGAIMTDATGTKRRIVEKMQSLSERYPDLYFVGAHPMAGREFSGIDHSTKNLFDRASLILVPVNLPLAGLAKMKEEALKIGFGDVVFTTAEEHDRIIAFTSQLAHVVSSAYVRSPSAEEHRGFSAGSYRDLTRVARLNPEMWTQLMLEDRDFLSEEIDGLIERLKEYSDALKANDRAALYAALAAGDERKRAVDSKRR